MDANMMQLLKMIGKPERIKVTIVFEMNLDPVSGGFSTVEWNEKWIRNHINNFNIPSNYEPSVVSVQGEMK